MMVAVSSGDRSSSKGTCVRQAGANQCGVPPSHRLRGRPGGLDTPAAARPSPAPLAGPGTPAPGPRTTSAAETSGLAGSPRRCPLREQGTGRSWYRPPPSPHPPPASPPRHPPRLHPRHCRRCSRRAPSRGVGRLTPRLPRQRPCKARERRNRAINCVLRAQWAQAHCSARCEHGLCGRQAVGRVGSGVAWLVPACADATAGTSVSALKAKRWQ